MKRSLQFCTTLFMMTFAIHVWGAESLSSQQVETVITPLMEKYQVPGVAIGISVDGDTKLYNYGVTSLDTQQPITENTLFEMGSLSKTFTATLAAYAEQIGALSFSQNVTFYVPALRSSVFDNVTVRQLATHVTGLPLFMPDDVKTNKDLVNYYRNWQPQYPIGSHRSYSNLGIGLLGIVTASSLNQTIDTAMEKTLLPALGLTNTYARVPRDKLQDYAQGYNKNNEPVRLQRQLLDTAAFGLKSSSKDLLHYLELNINPEKLSGPWAGAINATHYGYVKTDSFIQDLVWESYPYPTDLAKLQFGNRSEMALEPQEIETLSPLLKPQKNALYNKTGSSNGFSTYAIFIPEKKIAIVILANKWVPIPDRIDAMYQLLTNINKK